MRLQSSSTRKSLAPNAVSRASPSAANSADGGGGSTYHYDEGTDTGYMFLEFAGGRGYPRRHAFSQLDDDVFWLIPADSCDDVYYNEAFWSPNSKPHTNTGMVLLQKDRSSKYVHT